MLKLLTLTQQNNEIISFNSSKLVQLQKILQQKYDSDKELALKMFKGQEYAFLNFVLVNEIKFDKGELIKLIEESVQKNNEWKIINLRMLCKKRVILFEKDDFSNQELKMGYDKFIDKSWIKEELKYLKDFKNYSIKRIYDLKHSLSPEEAKEFLKKMSFDLKNIEILLDILIKYNVDIQKGVLEYEKNNLKHSNLVKAAIITKDKELLKKAGKYIDDVVSRFLKYHEGEQK